LLPFAVDDHASQYGTPTRLLHAARSDLVPEGWAIAEDTAVEAADGRVAVYGLGSAYRVRPAGGALAMQILGNGEHRDAG
jgi:cyanophycinase